MAVGVFSLLQLGPRIQNWDPILGIGTLLARSSRTHCHKEPSGSTNSAIKGYVIKSKRSKPKPIKTRFRKQIDIRIRVSRPSHAQSSNSPGSSRLSASIRAINSI